MQMDYYGYEYSVLSILNDELKIEYINKESEIYEALATVRNDIGIFENKVIKRIPIGNTITLNFTKDFHFCFDTKILKEAFEHEVPPKEIAMHLKKDIIDSFVKEFLLK